MEQIDGKSSVAANRIAVAIVALSEREKNIPNDNEVAAYLAGDKSKELKEKVIAAVANNAEFSSLFSQLQRAKKQIDDIEYQQQKHASLLEQVTSWLSNKFFLSGGLSGVGLAALAMILVMPYQGKFSDLDSLPSNTTSKGISSHSQSFESPEKTWAHLVKRACADYYAGKEITDNEVEGIKFVFKLLYKREVNLDIESMTNLCEKHR